MVKLKEGEHIIVINTATLPSHIDYILGIINQREYDVKKGNVAGVFVQDYDVVRQPGLMDVDRVYIAFGGEVP